MALTFYPHEDDLERAASIPVAEKLEILLEAAERYKAIVLDASAAASLPADTEALGPRRTTPADLKVAFNWEGIAQVLSEIRALSETGPREKASKAANLTKLSEVYEVLRAAKMPKLDAVRLSLVNEANQLRGGTKVVG